MDSTQIQLYHHLLWAFLYFASDKGHKPLPADKEVISALFIAGFIEWLAGKPAYEGDFKLKVKGLISDWEEWANKELENAVVSEKAKTVGHFMVQDLKELLQYRWRRVPPDFSGWVNEVEDWLRFSEYNFTNPYFNLSVSDVIEVEERVIPDLGSHTVQCLKEIAELSQKYLVQFFRR